MLLTTNFVAVPFVFISCTQDLLMDKINHSLKSEYVYPLIKNVRPIPRFANCNACMSLSRYHTSPISRFPRRDRVKEHIKLVLSCVESGSERPSDH